MNKLKFIDSHCHLIGILKDKNIGLKSCIYPELEKVIEKFDDRYDFKACVNVSCEGFDIAENLELLKFSKVWGTFGCHPHNAKFYSDEMEKDLVLANKHEKSVAWGECGLDYFYENSEKVVQMECFTRQLKCAVEMKLPVVIHSRDAADDTFEIMKKILDQDHFIHFHCFTYDGDVGIDFAKKIQYFTNLYIGFTGAITFKKSDPLRAVVKSVPLERILLETDSPYMAPGKYRGKTCHPGMIPLIGQQVADLHSTTLERVLEVTCANATRVYKLE